MILAGRQITVYHKWMKTLTNMCTFEIQVNSYIYVCPAFQYGAYAYDGFSHNGLYHILNKYKLINKGEKCIHGDDCQFGHDSQETRIRIVEYRMRQAVLKEDIERIEHQRYLRGTDRI